MDIQKYILYVFWDCQLSRVEELNSVIRGFVEFSGDFFFQ